MKPENKVKDVISSTKGNLTVIDGSILAFRASAAGEKRSISVTHRASGKEKDFEGRRAFKSWIKENEGFSLLDFDIEDVIVAPPVEQSYHICNEMIKGILARTGADDYRVFLDEGTTFRHTLATVMQYKGNRVNTKKPLNLANVKEFLVMNHKAEVVTGIEADDLLNMYQYEGYKLKMEGSNRKIIVATIDKDAFGCSGYVYDFRKDTDGNPIMREPLLIEGLGELKLHKNKVSGHGRKFLYYQILDCDTADNYKGRKLSGMKYSHTRAFKDLDPCSTDKECIEVLIKKYKEWYPEPKGYVSWDGKDLVATWETMLQEFTDLAFMQRFPNDRLKLVEVYVKMGGVVE